MNNMTNEEAIKEFEERLSIKDYKEQIPEYYQAMEYAIESLEENDNLKAENERLKQELENSVRLPFKAGTPIYIPLKRQGVVKDRIRRWQVYENKILFYTKGSALLPEAIGLSVFLTKEQAEKKLEELKGDKENGN